MDRKSKTKKQKQKQPQGPSAKTQPQDDTVSAAWRDELAKAYDFYLDDKTQVVGSDHKGGQLVGSGLRSG